MKKVFEKGFTLIELLVVVAIIGILSTVVLASLGTARTKAKDAKVKGQLSSARTQMTLYTDSNALVAGATCAVAPFNVAASAGGVKDILDATDKDINGTAATYANMSCKSTTPSNWAISVRLPSSPTTGTMKYFCVDSNGASKEISNTAIANTITAVSQCL